MFHYEERSSYESQSQVLGAVMLIVMEVGTFRLYLKQARRFLAYSSPSCFSFYIIGNQFQ